MLDLLLDALLSLSFIGILFRCFAASLSDKVGFLKYTSVKYTSVILYFRQTLLPLYLTSAIPYFRQTLLPSNLTSVKPNLVYNMTYPILPYLVWIEHQAHCVVVLSLARLVYAFQQINQNSQQFYITQAFATGVLRYFNSVMFCSGYTLTHSLFIREQYQA